MPTRSTSEEYYRRVNGKFACKYCGVTEDQAEQIVHRDSCPLQYMAYLERCIDLWAYEIQKTRLQRAVLKSVLRKIFALLEEHLPRWYLRGHYLMILNALGKKEGEQ